MRFTQIPTIESSGVTRFAPRYISPCLFLQPILIFSNFQVNSRLYSKRSYFGSRAVQVVEQFFKGDEFVNKPTRIAQYANWAVKNNGLALWRVPTPENCRHGPQSSKYIVRLATLTAFDDAHIRTSCTQAPVDIFESNFIIQVFAPFVKGCKESCVDYGYLIGALALSAAAVSGTTVLDVNRLTQHMDRLNMHSKCLSLARR